MKPENVTQSQQRNPPQWTIWVDADACPVVVKDILFRAAKRTQVALVLVANQYLRTPPSPFISFRQVAAGFDVADAQIIAWCQPGDLVISADIGLAAGALAKKAAVLDPRGHWFTEENIAEKLTMRDVMEQLRDTGMVSGGPSAYDQRDARQFASQLDRFLAKHP